MIVGVQSHSNDYAGNEQVNIHVSFARNHFPNAFKGANKTLNAFVHSFIFRYFIAKVGFFQKKQKLIYLFQLFYSK